MELKFVSYVYYRYSIIGINNNDIFSVILLVRINDIQLKIILIMKKRRWSLVGGDDDLFMTMMKTVPPAAAE